MQFQPPPSGQQSPQWQPPQYSPQPPYYPPQWQPQQPYYPHPYYPPAPPAPQYILSNQYVNVTNMGTLQYGCLIRAIYFVFIGWWLGLIWAFSAGLFCITIVGLPIGLTMFNFLPAVLTLQQH